MGIFTRFRDPNVILIILAIASLIVAISAWLFPVPGSQARLYFVVSGIAICVVCGVAVAWLALRRRVPDITDPLTDNNYEHDWIVTKPDQTDGSCVFEANGYHIKTLDPYYRLYKGVSGAICPINFVLQVDMKIITGEEGGVLFRWNEGKPDTFYYFYVRTDGISGLEKGEEREITDQHRVLWRLPNNKAVNHGLHRLYTIKVRAIGSVIDLYVNKKRLAHIVDQTDPYITGYIGFASGPKPKSEAIFTNLKVWEIN